jgi:hypothetical protein
MMAAMTVYNQTSLFPAENFLSVLAVKKGIRPGAIITVNREFLKGIQKTLIDAGLFAVPYAINPTVVSEVNLLLLNTSRRNLIPELLKVKKANISVNNRNTSTGKILGYVTPGPLSEVGSVRSGGRVVVQFRGPRGTEEVSIAPQKIVGNPEDYRAHFEAIKNGLQALGLPEGYTIESVDVELHQSGGSRTRKD